MNEAQPLTTDESDTSDPSRIFTLRLPDSTTPPQQPQEFPEYRQTRDIIQIRGYSLGEINSMRVEQIGPDTVIQLRREDVAILRNTQARTLTPANFIIEPPEEPAPISLLDQIRERGYLRAGASVDFPGLSTADSSGSYSGLAIDVSRAIAVALFNDPQAIRYQAQEFAQSFGNVATGAVDLSAAAQTLTRDASQNIDYSTPIFHDGAGILAPVNSGIASITDLDGLTVGVIQDSTAGQSLADASQDADVAVSITSFRQSAPCCAPT